MESQTLINRIIKEGLAENFYSATHIAEGLHLAQLKTEEEQMERVKRYRVLRKAGFKPKEAYGLVIRGAEQHTFTGYMGQAFTNPKVK